MSDETKGKRSISLLPHHKYQCPKKLLLSLKVCSLVKNTRKLIYLLYAKCDVCYIVIHLRIHRNSEMYYICTHSSSKETKLQFPKGYWKSRNAWPRGFKGILEQVGRRINTLVLRQALKKKLLVSSLPNLMNGLVLPSSIPSMKAAIHTPVLI